MGAVTATHKGSVVGKQLFQSSRNMVRRIKTVLVTTAATVDDGDTMDVTLADYGISDTGLLAIRGITHSTTNSVLVVEAPTTSVTSGVLTITIGGSTDNKVRSFLIWGEEA